MKRLLLLTTVLISFLHGMACTTFFINRNGQMVFGRNYDWVTETGVVNTNLRGLLKCSMELDGGKTFEWISKYGSISFNQYGKEFPTGGMNEKGLVVELMWLDESGFPPADERPALSVLQWIQYQLDNSSSIEEVIASDKNIRIDPHGAPQHYLIADANGNAATIEFLEGKMVVHQDKSLPYAVLANSTYESSLDAVSSPNTKKDNSLQRFSTACRLINTVPTADTTASLVDESFDILKNVAQGEFTKWSVVYDITNRKIHFKTAGFKDIKIIDMKAFDLSCSAQPLSFVMNTKANGKINASFVPFSAIINQKKLQQAFRESSSQIKVTSEEMNAMAEVARKVKCN